MVASVERIVNFPQIWEERVSLLGGHWWCQTGLRWVIHTYIRVYTDLISAIRFCSSFKFNFWLPQLGELVPLGAEAVLRGSQGAGA